MSLLWFELKVKLAFPCSRCACCWSMVFESTFFWRKISLRVLVFLCVLFLFHFFLFRDSPEGETEAEEARSRRRERETGERGGGSLKKTREISLSTNRKEHVATTRTANKKRTKDHREEIIEGRRKEKQSRTRRHFSSVVYIHITYIYIFTHELKHT